MSLQPVDPGIAENHHLSQRWPDLMLYRVFDELMTVFQRLSEIHSQDSDYPRTGICRAYDTICRWIQTSVDQCSDSWDSFRETQDPWRLNVHSLVMHLRRHYGDEWLQSLASLLAMLMHFSLSGRGAKLLVNHRRPQKAFSTYPNSPALARFVGDGLVSRLLKYPIPTICQRHSDAERYAERALAFRVLDPSMESGQLLLEVARGSIRQVLRNHSPSSKPARYLGRALLDKLCRDCLWGIDRNELAVSAVKLSFSLLGI